MNWLWHKREKRVDIENGGAWMWTEPEYGALKAYEWSLERASMVYTTLEKARDSFEGGRASYVNATEEIKRLIDEANKAARELIVAGKGIEKWLKPIESATPMPLDESFAGKGDDFIRFCREWIARQAGPAEVLGNSSRARSVRSRRVRPKIAKSASDSSSTQKELSSGHA